MPIVRIDPPKRGSRTSSRAGTGAAKGFVKGGYIGAAIGAVSGLFPQGSAEERASRYTVPVEFDTDTGDVRLLSLADGKDVGAKYGRERDQLKFRERASEALPILREIAATGEYQEGLPKGWSAVGQELARIAAQNPPTPRDYSMFEAVAEKPERAQSGRETNEDFFMGGMLPPGGMAGFAQMTGASRLALTRGARGRTTGTRRRKRRAKKASPVRRKRKARASSGRKRKLVKGSAAAKRYMASIRRKRRA